MAVQRLFQPTVSILLSRLIRTSSSTSSTITRLLNSSNDDGSKNSALSRKTYGQVLRGWFVFKMLSYDWVVRRSLTLYNISKKILGPNITKRLLKATVGGQFLGGFSEDEAKVVAETIAGNKICSVWNFSTEQDLSVSKEGDVKEQEARFDEVNNRYLKSIRLSGEYNYLDSSVKLAAVKLTAIVSPNILSKLSKMIVSVQQHKLNEVNGDMSELSSAGDQRRMEVADWMSRFELPYHISRLHEVSQSLGCQVTPFTTTELEQLDNLIIRLNDIGECARDESVRVLVDAEESRLQPAIHHLAVHYMMPRFNTSSQPLIYNTIQMYLKKSVETLLIDVATAKTSGFSYGSKLVRGAYMQYERAIAAEYDTEYPIHDNKEATDVSYDQGVQYVLNELVSGEREAGVGGVFIGSHNKHSIQQAVELMNDIEIPADTGVVCFGQQLGMADYISYALAENGYIIQKILAYGEDHDVIPFLVRRAQENNKTSLQAQFERKLYAKELKKRIWQ